MTIIKITFTDKTIELDNNFFLFKTSSFFKNALDCDENEILLPFFESSIIDNFKKYNNIDFLVTLSPDIFIKLYDFLNFILCEYNDYVFAVKFIKYIIENKIHLNGTFMYKEIHDCNNYMNDIDINKQIQSCSIVFYSIYLNDYKEEIIKNNRHDIYNYIHNNFEEHIEDKTLLFKYVYKYNNTLTEYLKSTKEYITYETTLGNNIISFIRNKQYNNIKLEIDNGGNLFINNASTLELLIESTCRDSELILYIIQRYLDHNHINTNTLNAAIKKSRLNIIKYLMKHCKQYIDINNVDLFVTIKNDKLNILKYLISQGAPILMVDNTNSTLLMYACKENNFDFIQYIINNIPSELLNNYIYIQDNTGKNAIQYATNYIETFNIFVPYINNDNIEIGKQILTSSLENMNNEVIYKVLECYINNLSLLLDFIEPDIYFIDKLYNKLSLENNKYIQFGPQQAMQMLLQIVPAHVITQLHLQNITQQYIQQLNLNKNIYAQIYTTIYDNNLIYQLCNYILHQNITTTLINKIFINIIKYNDIKLVSIFLNDCITLETYYSIFEQIISYRNKIYLCTLFRDNVIKLYLDKYNEIATLILNNMKIIYPNNDFQINNYVDNNNICIFTGKYNYNTSYI